MRKLTVGLLLIGILIMTERADAALITKTANYVGAVPIVDASSDTRVQTVLLADNPANALITDVNVTIDLTKSGDLIDANGDPTGGGFTFNREIVLRLLSPTGTLVNLVNEDTYSGEDTSVRRTVTFDDAAANPVGGSFIVNGTFSPVGSLSSFNGETTAGNWTLYFGDTVAADPLSVNSWTLDIETASVPEPTALAIWGLFGACGFGLAARRRRKAA